MATYQEQIKSAFDKYSTSGKDKKDIYEAMKKKLAGNTNALNTLEQYYSGINPSTTVTPATTTTTTSPSRTDTSNVSQIKSAFDKYSTAGKNSKDIYEAMKKKLSGNMNALSSLENYYNSLNTTPSTADSSVIKRETYKASNNAQYELRTKPDGTVEFTSADPTLGNRVFKSKDEAIKTIEDVAKKNVVAPSTADSSVVKRETYKASNNSQYELRTKPDGTVEFTSGDPTLGNRVFKSKDEAIKTIEDVAKKNVVAPFTAEPMKSDGVSNKAKETITGSFLDPDTASAYRNQVNTINKEFDDRIKNQQDYANNVMDSYNKFSKEFGDKYNQQRELINKMESELNSNYQDYKKFVQDSYADSMDTYARQAAAKRAGVSSKLAASGISGDVLANAISEAENDPNRIKAINDLKENQIKKLVDLQTNYQNWYNNIVTQNSNLTSSEKDLADTILKRKDLLDTELQNIKQTNISEVYAPIKKLLGEKAESLGKVDMATDKRQKDLADFISANDNEKKDLLLDKLYALNVDRSFITEALMNEAIKKGSLPDAIIYLANNINDLQAKQKLLSDNFTSAGKVSTTQDNTSKIQSAIDSAIAQGKNPQGIKDELKSKGLTDEQINKFTFGNSTSTNPIDGTIIKNNKKNIPFDGTIIKNNKKNIPSSIREFEEGLKSGFVGFGADRAKNLLLKLPQKAISAFPESMRNGIANLIKKSVGETGISEVDDKLAQFIDELLKRGITGVQIMNAADESIKKRVSKILETRGVSAVERKFLEKIGQYGLKAVPVIKKAGTAGLKFLGSKTFGVVTGLIDPQGEAGGDMYEATPKSKSILDKYLPEIKQGIIKISGDDINSLNEEEKQWLINQINLHKPYISKQ